MPGDLAGQWRQAAAAVIEAAIPADTNPPETWPVCAALLPHARVALADDSDGVARIANYVGWSGSYAAARDLERKIADAIERVLGAEHPDTLTARARLAYWTGYSEDLAAARDQFAALLPACERVLGAEHPETLAAGVHLADWTGVAGDPAAARDQLAALLPACERVLGAEHPETLAARAHLARWTGDAGNPAGPGTSVPRCCWPASRSSAPSTPTPSPPKPALPTGPAKSAETNQRSSADDRLSRIELAPAYSSLGYPLNRTGSCSCISAVRHGRSAAGRSRLGGCPVPPLARFARRGFLLASRSAYRTGSWPAASSRTR